MLKIILSFLLVSSISGVYNPRIDFSHIKAGGLSPVRVNPENIGVKVSSDKFIAVDVGTGKVLLQKGGNERQAVASITKLMTALVILEENPDWYDKVTMSKSDETVGAQPHIYRGEQVRFIDLWKASLVCSDNNSIMAMIRHLNFDLDEFVKKMNLKAKELKMHKSHFADPTGLNKNNLSTVTDISKLLSAALRKNEIKESVMQSKYVFDILNSFKTRKIYNTDILIDSFLNNKRYGYELIGGKTGFLPEAGYCLATKIAYDHRPIIIVVLNSATIESRFQDVKVIADWIYHNYVWQ
ncbi:MAG TPA: serine hydrolase [Patescibacteria group bacterium]|nr:serine hydrolase [Patescibacteria group bacterium]